MTNSAPNSFLNAAQRKIIIDWVIETEEETSLIDGTITEYELELMRKEMESWKNYELHIEMNNIDCVELNNMVRNAS